MTRSLTALAAGLLAAACHHSRPSLGPDVTVTLERTPCFGFCPAYEVTLDGGGLVRFRTRGPVRVLRSVRADSAVIDTLPQVPLDSARVPAQRVAALVRELERAGFFTLAERYTPEDPAACGQHRTDAPSATLTVTRSGATKRVEHYHGCEGAPAALSRLENLVDSTADVGRWLDPKRARR